MAGPRYVADEKALIRKVELDGLAALFHLPSGMTHILAPPAPQILDVIAAEPGDAGEILGRMSRSFDVERGEESERAIEARLQELEAAGLVRKA